MAHKSLSSYDQINLLPEVKAVRPEYTDIHSQVLQDVLRRVDRTFQAFFRRVKVGETPGYPRFKGAGWYDPFTYPQTGWALQHSTGAKKGTVRLSKIGTLKVRMHRAVQGQVKTVSVKREGEQWYVCFSVEGADEAPMPHSDGAVAIDLGLTTFGTLNTGERIENPQHLRKSLPKLAEAQQKLSRKKKGSHRRNRAKKAVAKLHRDIRNQRADFHHKQSRKLVNEYGTIVFEKLQPANMVRNHNLALSISDAGWGQFTQMCVCKAASAGRAVVFVDPRNTSQMCSSCGAMPTVPKTLADRWHSCPCGCELDRDHNAALNILHRWAGTAPQSA